MQHAPRTRPKRIVLEARHIIVLACFLATLSAYVERVGFSIAYTAMAKAEKVDESTKGTVLSAFYWGYGVAQVGCPAHTKWNPPPCFNNRLLLMFIQGCLGVLQLSWWWCTSLQTAQVV